MDSTGVHKFELGNEDINILDSNKPLAFDMKATKQTD